MKKLTCCLGVAVIMLVATPTPSQAGNSICDATLELTTCSTGAPRTTIDQVAVCGEGSPEGPCTSNLPRGKGLLEKASETARKILRGLFGG